MLFTKTSLEGSFLIQAERIEDNRGYFATTFAVPDFEAHGLSARVLQTSTSFNKQKGTVRGMHLQLAPYTETKLVRCIAGAIFDVLVDLRPGSATFGKWEGFELSSENMNMLYIPEGFAHGFQTLTDNAEVAYMLGQVYSPNHARGLCHNEAAIGIKWPLELTVISARDAQLPGLTELRKELEAAAPCSKSTAGQ